MKNRQWFIYAFALLLSCVLISDAAAARRRTGLIEKMKVDNKKFTIFKDTLYGYSLKSPDGWEFKAQKEKKDKINPYRLHARLKDKQLPAQMWDSPSAVTPAQVLIFIWDSELTPEQIRDSLASPTFKGDWQKPIINACDILYGADFLNKMDIRWEGTWKGSAYSVKRNYTAQIPSGSGGFGTISEALLGEFYIFPFKGHTMLVHLLSEREFLKENRETVKEILLQMVMLEPEPAEEPE